MAKKEASVAPKERINVTFKPATGNAVEEIELPLKVSVMGDFYQRKDDRLLIDRKPVSINKSNFNEVMGKSNLNIDLAAPNPLDESGDATIPVHLSFKSMRDFSPEALIEQVPMLRDMKEIRNALVSLRGPLGNVPAFTAAIKRVLADSDQRERLQKEIEAAGLDLNAFLEPAGKTSSSKKGKEKKSAK